jgi:hydroxymethylpyrimidine/phosphomethylpyrimidine kinase
LLKGGDVQNSNESSDLLLSHEESRWLTAPRVHGYEVRGTGCMLASAIAAQRAQNIPVLEAVAAAKTWLTGQIKNAQPLGKGRRVAVGG